MDRKYSQAQFALMQAVERANSLSDGGANVIDIADRYYNWLINKEGR